MTQSSVTPEQSGGTGTSAAQPPKRRGRATVLIVVGVLCPVVVGFIAYAVIAARVHSTGPVSQPTLSSLARGTEAPDFTLARLGGGTEVRLAGDRGKPTIVNFFASWCTDCRAELGAFGRVSHLAGARVNFVGVDSNDTNEALARRLLAQAGVRYPVGVDGNGTVASRDFSIAYLPVTYLLDARGRVVGASYGSQTTKSLEHWVSVLTGSGSPR